METKNSIGSRVFTIRCDLASFLSLKPILRALGFWRKVRRRVNPQLSASESAGWPLLAMDIHISLVLRADHPNPLSPAPHPPPPRPDPPHPYHPCVTVQNVSVRVPTGLR